MDLLRRFLLSLTFTFTITATTVQGAPSIEDYGSLASVQKMAVSPDGTLVAFRRYSPENDLLVVYSLTENKVIRAVEIGNIKPHHLYFLDHARVIMVASQEKRLIGYRGSHQISTAFALDAHSGNVSQLLTPGDVIFKGQSGLGQILAVSSDGKFVYMPAFVGESKHDETPNYSLMRVNLDSVKRPRIIKKGTHNTIDYFVDPEGKVLAEEIFSNHSNYHAIVSYIGEKEAEIFRQKTDIPTFGVVGLTPDRKSLIIVD